MIRNDGNLLASLLGLKLSWGLNVPWMKKEKSAPKSALLKSRSINLNNCSEILDTNTIDNKDECDHENKTYQPREWDTNVPESYSCDECGEELDLPEPDEDMYRDR